MSSTKAYLEVLNLGDGRMAVFEEQIKVISKGTDEIVDVKGLQKKIEEKGQITIKFGMDPTAPDLHLGHAVVLRKIRQFQSLGHKALIIIGDFTGRVGDPTGKDKARKHLTKEAVVKNGKTYTDQLFKILDPEMTEIKYNSEWLSSLGMDDILEICSKHTVARMMEREGFKSRFKDNRPIFLHEFFYPILQGYDSVAIKADIELGGCDQRFNILMGRTMQGQEGMPMQSALFMPLLEGLDGLEKMSKSLGNHIGIDEPPFDMYKKVMTVPDDLLIRYFNLCTDLHPDDIEVFQKQLSSGEVHPRDLKMVLAHEITSLYHGPALADDAEKEFIHVFNKKQLPNVLKEIFASQNDSLLDIMVSASFASSKSEARRLIQQSGVKLNQLLVDDLHVLPNNGDILQVGKKKFGRIVF